MERRFECGCIVDENDILQFCKDHYMDYLITGNVIYPKDNDGNIFLIKDSPIIEPFGHSIFSDMKELKLK